MGNGLRWLLIHGLTRQQQIDFIKRRDKSYRQTNFSAQTDEQILNTALSVDKKVQADRQNKKAKK